MLNLPAMFTLGEAVFSLIPFLFFAVFIGVFVVSAKKAQNQENQTNNKPYAPRPTANTTKPKTVTTKKVEERMCLHDENDGHTHSGEAEQYQEIVGSLGEVNDEGCKELSGVRLIAHDQAYDDENASLYDVDKVGQALVLGEILGNPRFKGGYKRK